MGMRLSIQRFILADILRARVMIGYTVLLALLGWSVFSLEEDSHKGILTLLHLILLATPLVCIIFTTIYLYNSAEFIELLLSQPVTRRNVWTSLFLGLFLSMGLSFWLGAGIPIILFSGFELAMVLLIAGTLLSAVFVALGFLCNAITRDKAKGIGMAILLWLFFSLLFDGLVLFLSFQFADYPIEKPMVVLAAMNPVDLARIYIILKLDVSAMLGYTGAIFKEFFGARWGMLIGLALMILWTIIPYGLSLRLFCKRDW